MTVTSVAPTVPEQAHAVVVKERGAGNCSYHGGDADGGAACTSGGVPASLLLG